MVLCKKEHEVEVNIVAQLARTKNLGSVSAKCHVTLAFVSDCHERTTCTLSRQHAA